MLLSSLDIGDASDAKSLQAWRAVDPAFALIPSRKPESGAGLEVEDSTAELTSTPSFR
jgi:hypothetical protein